MIAERSVPSLRQAGLNLYAPTKAPVVPTN